MTQNDRFDKYSILTGIIRSAHAIHGTVKVEAVSDNPKRFSIGNSFWADSLQKIVKIDACQQANKYFLVHFEGINDRTEAEKLRGCRLMIEPSNVEPLPEGYYYHFQLMNLSVYENDLLLGRIVDILSNPANDIYVMETPDKNQVMIPALKSIVSKIDLQNKRMEVQLPQGL